MRRRRHGVSRSGGVAALLLGLSIALLPIAALALPSFAEVRAAHRSSDITLLDRDGIPVQTLRVDQSVRRLPWVPLADMSPALLNALVVSEDKHFYEHAGVDWSAVTRSAWANLFNNRTRGASTLTMQLAGLLDDGLARPAGGRSAVQKLGQVLTAKQLEAHWTKSEILEAYLNEVPFRGEAVGIGALAETLFGRHPGGLDAEQAAIAAALVRGPNARPVTVAERACRVLRLQRQQQQQSCTGVGVLTETVLARHGDALPPLGEQLAPHFAHRVIAVDGPAEQRSTLDASLQRLANVSLRRQLAELSGRHVEDGAVVVLDNTSGAVLAWVGSSGPLLSDAAEVDGVLAARQPGSTLKPFVYELAFEKRLITPASLLDDAPTQIATAGGLYLPQDYEPDFKGWVSARTALGASLNVPAVRVGALLGADALVERLNAFGLALAHPGGYYGNALALGSAEVDLLSLTNAYRALANGGVYTPVRMRPSGDARPARTTRVETTATTAGSKPTRVATAAATFLVSDILADNNARVRTFGSASSLATRGYAAVKTGTSKDMRDNWCIGFSDTYTIGVWVGNASGEAMHGVSGVSGAAPVWRTLVDYLHAARPSQRPRPPADVVGLPVRFEAEREPARKEWFLAGTEQRAPQQRAGALVTGAERFGITSPRDGSIFAIDPDMPPSAQRLSFEGEAGIWLLDGRRLGGTPSRPVSRWRWPPWPGRHVLTLQGGRGQALQTVHFEVRGAGVKAALPERRRGAAAATEAHRQAERQ